MQTQAITAVLTECFGSDAVQTPTEDSWQVDTPQFRLLAILSPDQSWLRLLIPLVSATDAQPYLEQLLEANFDLTQEVRYALNQGVVWGVYQHNLVTLTDEDLRSAIAQLMSLQEQSLSASFNQLIEQRLRQIIQAAKLQGQTLESTLQNLNRFYEEGMLGDLQQDSQEREQFLAAWQYQLTRLWPEVEP